MKIVHEEILFGAELIAKDPDIAAAMQDIRRAIKNVVWPDGARKFRIRPVIDGNGVLPIKLGFVRRLKALGWRIEERPIIAAGLGAGKIDALKTMAAGPQFAAEWETGNISSSHRALNKMCLGILEQHLVGGVLILPDRHLYNFLTQRIGNYREIAPYFPVYHRLKITTGILAVFAVSFDETSADVPLIPKGMDGNSLVRRARLSDI